MRLWKKKRRPKYPVMGQEFSSRFDRNVGHRFDWGIAVVVLFLVITGIMNLYSAVQGSLTKEALFAAQVRWFIICAGLMFVIYLINYHFYEAASWSIFGFVIFLLVLTLVVGITTKGSARWVGIGAFRFQPSEISKIAMVLVLARFFSQKPRTAGYSLRELGIPFLILLAPTVLILLEPDLGTAILHVLIFGSVCMFVGIKKRSILTLAGALTAVLPLAWFFILKEYQRARILTLFNPDRDPLGTSYHIRQSLIAVGSGKFFGNGYLQGTQSKLEFLPETHTDFVFSVLAEEWGFFGCLIVLGLYFILITWAVSIAAKSKDRFGSIAAFGLASILFWHVFINVGMVLNLMPVVGVVLPFFSYGRTSAFTMLAVVTLLMNISSRRYMFE